MKKLLAFALVIVSLLAIAIPAMAATPAYARYLGDDTTSDILMRGHTGIAVRNLQVMLNYLDFECGTPDGIFGSNTQNAVIKFQRACSLDADGNVGPMTKRALWTAVGQSAPTGCTPLY